MKKTLLISALSVYFVFVVLSVNAYALTNAEMDMYNHQYYPQSINNGGIRQAPQMEEHDL